MLVLICFGATAIVHDQVASVDVASAAVKIQTLCRMRHQRVFYILLRDTLALERAVSEFVEAVDDAPTAQVGTLSTRDQVQHWQDRHDRLLETLRSSLVELANSAGADAMTAQLDATFPFRARLGGAWESANDAATKMCLDRSGEFLDQVKALIRVRDYDRTDIVDVMSAIVSFESQCVRARAVPTSYMLKLCDTARDALTRRIALAKKDITAHVSAAGFDLRRVTAVVQKYEDSYMAVKPLADEPLGEDYEMILARRSALLGTARIQVERTVCSGDLREVCDAIAYCSGVAELRSEIQKLEQQQAVILTVQKKEWMRMAQSDDVVALHNAVDLCRLCKELCRDELFGLRRRLETLAHVAIKALTEALSSHDPKALDETISEYKHYLPSSASIWYKLQDHRRSMPEYWAGRAQALLSTTELLPVQQAVVALQYLRMDQQHNALKSWLEKIAHDISAQIRVATAKSDSAKLIAEMLHKTSGCEHLFGPELDLLREQYEPIVCEARIALSELLQSNSPSNLVDIDDALLAYGSFPTDTSIMRHVDQLKEHRHRIVEDAKSHLEQGMLLDDVQTISSTLQHFESTAISPEWIALDQQRNFMHTQARERLSNLLETKDIVEIANALNEFAGGWSRATLSIYRRPSPLLTVISS